MIKYFRLFINGGVVSAVMLFSGSSGICAQITSLNSKIIFLKNEDSSLTFLNEVQGIDILRMAKVLASDSMEGRATGSKGFEKAANLVSEHFKVHDIKVQFQNFKLAKKDLRTKIFIDSTAGDSVRAFNLIGFLEGTELKDEFVVISAHLDHLGKNDDKIYHGANDNASGVSVMMELAEMFVAHRPKRSMLFIAFTGEEAGLLGSEFFVSHPWMDLEKIRWMVNLDLVGSGSEGLMIQGYEHFLKDFEAVSNLNKKYFHFELSTRPNSPNSDQYFFNAQGVPAFFIYAYKGTIPYHDPQDTWEKLDPVILENVAKFVALCVLHFSAN